MSQCFTHVFDRAKTEFGKSVAKIGEEELFSSFMSHHDVFGFIYNDDLPADDEAVAVARKIDNDMYIRYLVANSQKKPIGYNGGFPSKNAAYNELDSRHCMMSIILFKYIHGPIDHIIEIGGGYGNWLRLNYPVQSFSKWSIIDIDHVGKLQKWCLNQWNIPESVYDIVSADDYVHVAPADIVIGSHSLSELSYDHFKAYFDNILVKTKYFFYAYHRSSPSVDLIHKKNLLLQTTFDTVTIVPSQSGEVFNCVLKNKIVHKEDSKPSELIVCSVFKNEAHILDEWIRHYLARGANHIYLVNDFSTDNFSEITNRFADQVTIFHNDIVTHQPGRQSMIYEKYFRPLIKPSVWVAIMDLDEFLYSPDTMDLRNLLTRYNSYSQVLVDWLHFGSGGHSYQPQSVVEGFQMRASLDTRKPYYSYKSIFKGDCLVKFGVHRNEVNGPTYHERTSLLINHYTIQSLEFFMNVKATRGDCDNHFTLNNLRRDRAYFDGYDINDVRDSRLCDQNIDITEIVKKNCIGTSDEITMTITSCNRPQLLNETLRSFVEMNTYPIKETYIIDDSGVIGCNDDVAVKYPKLNIKLIYNAKNIGQVESIDKMYSYVRTKWIFHCEEDWEFIKPGFIEKSKQVFDENPNEKIFTVWMRAHNDSSGHPIVYDGLNRGYYIMKKDYSYVHRGDIYVWGGITFNPGLRRSDVCLKFHPYEEKCGKIRHNGKEYVGEYPVNYKYLTHGYYSMTLGDSSGHVRHIGANFHIPRIWD